MNISKKIKLIIISVTLSGLVPFLGNAGANRTIEMNDESYTPRNLEIKTGDTVTFKNAGKEDKWPASNIHPTHQIYPEFDPGKPISPGDSWQFTFDKDGTWKYHDHLYPNITGTIEVGSGDNPAKNGPSKTFVQRLLSPFRYLYEKIFLTFKKTPQEKPSENISKDSKNIFQDKEALKDYIKAYGPKETIQRLNTLSAEFGSCHDSAHEAGHISYELLGDKAFKECGSECHSGCYHGATEAYFKEHGTANLSENLNTLCGSELNSFFSHQCIHGIGHGLMAWANYEIFEALKSCDMLNQRQDSCWTGVFMENIVGGLTDKKDATGHFTKYLNDDPQYPCNIVDDKYKSSCYFLQTSRMVQLLLNDFSKVTSACLEAPTQYQSSCFSSMGRDIGGVYRNNPAGAIKACGYSPKGHLRTACLMGAAQDTFWDPTGQDAAINFCKLLIDEDEKTACYSTAFGRATEVLTNKTDLDNFCAKAEKEYQKLCIK